MQEEHKLQTGRELVRTTVFTKVASIVQIWFNPASQKTYLQTYPGTWVLFPGDACYRGTYIYPPPQERSHRNQPQPHGTAVRGHQ